MKNHSYTATWDLPTLLTIFVFVFTFNCFSDVARSQGINGSKPGSTENNQTSQIGAWGNYIVEGLITDRFTGSPIADAEVRILVDAEPDLSKRVLKVRSDTSGHYRASVPIGAVRIWFPSIRPGYWLENTQGNNAILITTKQGPVARHDLVATAAPSWRVWCDGEMPEDTSQRNISVYEVPEDDLRRKILKGEPWSSNGPLNQWLSVLARERSGAFTQIGYSGKLIVGVCGTNAELLIEKGFDNLHVISVRTLADSLITELQDTNGLKATVRNASVTLNESIPTLVFKAAAQDKTEFRLIGSVVDQNEHAVEGAEIRVLVWSKVNGGIWPFESAFTDSSGRFDFGVATQQGWKKLDVQKAKIAISVRHHDFETTDSNYSTLIASHQEFDFGTISLRQGNSLRFQVHDSKGFPASGAVVRVTSSNTRDILSVRTDESGEAIVHGLPLDAIRVSAQYGDEHAAQRLVVDTASPSSVISIEMKKSIANNSAVDERVTPLAVGELAPEWSVADWSDGKPRKLSDYRGKVVVIDFWGLWCGGCITSIPAMKQIAREFDKQPVVFFGIHSADGNLERIDKLKKLKGWQIVSALDQGTSIPDSTTWKAYGVQGAPTWVIIGVDGKIAYRSDVRPNGTEIFMEEQRKLAEAHGIPWPLPDDCTPEESNEISNKLVVAILSNALKETLKKSK